jgi:hypothetical protein
MIMSGDVGGSLTRDPQDRPIGLAALIVGVVVSGAAGLLALVGKKQAQRAGPLVPAESAASVKADINTIKEGMHR